MFDNVMRSFTLLLGICIVVIVGTAGCGDDEDDDNEWVGTWAMETVDGESFEQAFYEVRGNVKILTNKWRFDSDGTMEVEIAMKFETKEDGLEISGEGSMKMTGVYSLSGVYYTLIPIVLEGTGIFEEDAGSVAPTHMDTGTWFRSGKTLTLISDDGSTIVFKKK